jgi:hypothetical protein
MFTMPLIPTRHEMADAPHGESEKGDVAVTGSTKKYEYLAAYWHVQMPTVPHRFEEGRNEDGKVYLGL